MVHYCFIMFVYEKKLTFLPELLQYEKSTHRQHLLNYLRTSQNFEQDANPLASAKELEFHLVVKDNIFCLAM